MKTFRIFLFIIAAILAPTVASAAKITITSLSGAVADFHPVFSGASQNANSFVTNSGTASAPFDVNTDTSYPVNKLVNGLLVQIGTVSWNSAGVPTYVPNP